MPASRTPIDLRQLLPDHVPTVRRVLERLCRGGGVAADLEDLVQEVVLRCLRYEHAYDPDALGRRGLRRERLDQLLVEHLMGAR